MSLYSVSNTVVTIANTFNANSNTLVAIPAYTYNISLNAVANTYTIVFGPSNTTITIPIVNVNSTINNTSNIQIWNIVATNANNNYANANAVAIINALSYLFELAPNWSNITDNVGGTVINGTSNSSLSQNLLSGTPQASDPQHYNLTFTVVGANGIPSGLSLAANGMITGTPTSSGNTIITIRANNSIG